VFYGTLEQKDDIIIRYTTQSNTAYPGQDTTVSARWVRIHHGQRGEDPNLTYRNNTVLSNGRPCDGVDNTSRGGQYIDCKLFSGSRVP